MKNFIILIVFAFMSCGENFENSKSIYFNNLKIKVPTFLTIETSSSCENEITLKDTEETNLIEFKICNYGLKTGRQSYQKLNKFFLEECNLLNTEIPEAVFIDKKSSNNGNYYGFIHEFKIGKKYYCNNYIAYKKYFLTIRFQSQQKNNILEFKKITKKFIKKDLSYNIELKENKKDCYNCKSPLFW